MCLRFMERADVTLRLLKLSLRQQLVQSHDMVPEIVDILGVFQVASLQVFVVFLYHCVHGLEHFILLFLFFLLHLERKQNLNQDDCRQHCYPCHCQ